MEKTASQNQEEKFIKNGYAYRHFIQKRIWINVLFFGWIIGMPFITRGLDSKLFLGIYIVGAVVFYIPYMRTMFFHSWVCPNCKKDLPSKPQPYRYSTKDPKLVGECLYCGYDLTKAKKAQ